MSVEIPSFQIFAYNDQHTPLETVHARMRGFDVTYAMNNIDTSIFTGHFNRDNAPFFFQTIRRKSKYELVKFDKEAGRSYTAIPKERFEQVQIPQAVYQADYARDVYVVIMLDKLTQKRIALFSSNASFKQGPEKILKEIKAPSCDYHIIHTQTYHDDVRFEERRLSLVERLFQKIKALFCRTFLYSTAPGKPKTDIKGTFITCSRTIEVKVQESLIKRIWEKVTRSSKAENPQAHKV